MMRACVHFHFRFFLFMCTPSLLYGVSHRIAALSFTRVKLTQLISIDYNDSFVLEVEI